MVGNPNQVRRKNSYVMHKISIILTAGSFHKATMFVSKILYLFHTIDDTILGKLKEAHRSVAIIEVTFT